MKFPNVGDWKELGRLVWYVRTTIHLQLTIRLDGTRNMVWSIDTSFSVHIYMTSHTGYFITLGIGFHISRVSGRKVNTRKLTESELVGVNDVIGFVEWPAFIVMTR